MSAKRLLLTITALIGGGMASGCGNEATPSPSKSQAGSNARSDATRNVIIQQNMNNYIPSSQPDYGAGMKF
jgi:hypothetical protein